MADDDRVSLIRPADRTIGHPTPGMYREQATSTDRTWAGYVTTEAGMVSGWHHHGDYESHIYVLSGAMRMESGPGGADVVEARSGDFIFVPPHTVHRESNPASEESTVVVVRAGTGEPVVNVDGPDAAAGD
ncbi:MAG: cupin domain-containing protein [Angustibacter sp.]